MRKKSKNRKLIIILMILVAFISVGYAAISSNLQINGLTTIEKQTWDVHFENVKLKEGSVNVIPQITSPTNVEYSVELDKPGDYHEFIVDVVNGGTIDAMIDSLDVKPNLTNEQKKYIDFSVTYENGNAITSKQLLSSGETKKVKVSLTYRDDITSKDLPNETTTLDVSIKDNYIQASDSAVEVHDKNYLMVADPTNSEEIPAFNGPILKNQVEKIYTLYTINIPENVIHSWDVSENQNGSIMAYTLDEDNDNMYELYLAQDGGVLANPNSTKLFYNFINVVNMDVSNLNTSEIIDATGMFSHCEKIQTLDLNSWDITKIKKLNYIFDCCYNLTNINFDEWDTSKVTNMMGMFIFCSSLTSLDLSSFNTSNVSTMYAMFSNCTNLSSLNIRNWNTSNVTNMGVMFQLCENLVKIEGIEKIDTSNVTNMAWMFNKCLKLENLNLNNFDTSKVKDMKAMFQKCTSLKTLDVSNFDTSNVTDMKYMFNGCDSLKTLDASNFDTSNVTEMRSMFNSCTSLENINISNFDISNTTDLSYMFYGNSKLQEIIVGPKWVINDGVTTANMFTGAGVSSVTRKQ